MNKPEIRLDIITPFIKSYLDRQNDDNILQIYNLYKDDELIKWKESIKKIAGIYVPNESGLDI